MDYKEKYEQGLECIQEILSSGQEKIKMTLLKERLQPFFPELGESEDELTWLTKFIEEEAHSLSMDIRDNEDRIKLKKLKKSLAWLEKQGEQKPILNVPSREVILSIWDLGNEWKELTDGSVWTKYGTQLDYIQKHWHESEYYLREKQGEKKATDKVEPKFHEGDWIIDKQGIVHQIKKVIENVTNNTFAYDLVGGGYFNEEVKSCRLWTIQDAKDGDVLYSLDSKQPFIFKHRKPNEQAAVYCGINTYGKFFIGNTKDCVITTDKYIPADKFQRDLLFKKIEEAGYQWDAKNKELKLLISNGGDFESNNSKQKPTWSEEDEEFYNDIIKYFSDLDYSLSNDEDDVINWLKSLKERLI